MGSLSRIVIHWTAGTNQPNNTDFEHYHFLINGDGVLFNGKYIPEDNINCNDGKYAQHTKLGNTGSIGIAVCGMYRFNEKTLKTNYPLTQIQCEKLFFEVARLCKKYSILIENVTTHYEYNQKHNINTGKIDIIYLPPYPHIKKENIADFIRSKILWYYKRI